jgi:hypothetical protein
MDWLTSLLAAIIRPIIQEELRDLKAWAFLQSERLKQYEKIDQEAEELIQAMAQATTAEERWAHLRRLQSLRASLR